MISKPVSHLRLVGDIGGTNVRLALVDVSGPVPKLTAPESHPRADFPNFEDVVAHFLRQHADAGQPAAIAVAVAGVIDNGEVKLTNGQWHLSEKKLLELGFVVARLLNDYTALAYSLPWLKGDDLAAIGDVASRHPEESLALVGAGTGLGVSALIRNGSRVCVATTEGGHMSFAPVDEIDIEILTHLTQRYSRVSMERVLSGPGLSNIRWALGRMSGEDLDPIGPDEVVRLARAKSDPLCVQALERFCGIYGRVCGDFALAFGARGGVFLGGGIAPKLLDVLRGGTFRRHFEAKGRFVPYVASVPTNVIMHPYATLVGAAAAPLNED
jgi:glucokinase